jgi:hypothetical protein
MGFFFCNLRLWVIMITWVNDIWVTQVKGILVTWVNDIWVTWGLKGNLGNLGHGYFCNVGCSDTSLNICQRQHEP